MAQLGRFDNTFLNLDGSPSTGASCTVYREGATVNGTQSGASPLTVTVRHRGKIAAGDTVFIGTTTGTTYSVNSVTATTVVLSGFVGTLNLSGGDRITPSNSLPTLYSDDQGGATTGNPLTTSSTGRANCWMEFGAYDLILSGGGATTTAFTAQVTPSQAPGQVRYADEFGSIQLAVNDLPSTGGTVRLSANTTYTVTAAVTVPDDVEIVGGGYSTIVKKNVGTAMGCFVNSGANTLGTGTQNNRIIIRNLKILGEATATTNYAIRMENVDNFRIENVWCQDILTGDSAAIDIDSCQHFFVRGCYVNNCTNNGIKVRCQAEASTDFVISNNVVDTTASQNGIFVANSATFAATRFSITGNTVKSVGDVGIEVGNTGAAQHTAFSITGNTVDSASGDGILARESASGTITGNTVRLGGNAASSAGIGLLASAVDCTDITISGNTVTGRTAGAGIRTGLASTFRCRRLTITGNTVTMGIGSTSGIEFQGFGDLSVISHNVISNAPSSGIALVGSSAASRPIQRCSIIGNVISGCTSNGISADNAVDCKFIGNKCYNNGGYGISFTDSPSGNDNWDNDLRTNTSGGYNGITQSITAVGNTINVTNSLIYLSANGAYTMTSTPTIQAGYEGQRITLVNIGGVNAITLQDESALAGSHLYLKSSPTTLVASKGNVELVFNLGIVANGGWIAT